MNAAFNEEFLSMVGKNFGVDPAELTRLMSSDPTELMMKMMQSSGDAVADDEDDLAKALDGLDFHADNPDAIEGEAVDVTPEREQIDLEALQTLIGEFEAAEALLTHVAGVLGACPRCFGTDGDCDVCRGRGGPGFEQSSDPNSLAAWIAGLTAGLGRHVRPRQSFHPKEKANG